jgi:ABC-type multidrug transport system fused ATPase/permease subunit
MFMLIATLTTSLFGFFYAYIKCWQLSLVLTGALPLMMIGGVLLMKSISNIATYGKTSYEDAAGRAEQVRLMYNLGLWRNKNNQKFSWRDILRIYIP